MKAVFHTQLGYYDFCGTPTVISPWATRHVDFGVTIQHESIHKELVTNSSTGLLCVLISLALGCCGKQVTPSLRRELVSLRSAIVTHSRETHESAATYLSLLGLSAKTPPRKDKSLFTQYCQILDVKTLDEFYRDAVRLISSRFGCPVIGTPLAYYLLCWSIVEAIALVALSPPFPEATHDLIRIKEVRKVIACNTPDVRFKAILSTLSNQGIINFLLKNVAREWVKSLGRERWNELSKPTVTEDYDLLIDSEWEHSRRITRLTVDTIGNYAAKNGFAVQVDSGVLCSQFKSIAASWSSVLSSFGCHEFENISIIDLNSSPSAFDYAHPKVAVPGCHELYQDWFVSNVPIVNLDVKQMYVLGTFAKASGFCTFVSIIPVITDFESKDLWYGTKENEGRSLFIYGFLGKPLKSSKEGASPTKPPLEWYTYSFYDKIATCSRSTSLKKGTLAPKSIRTTGEWGRPFWGRFDIKEAESLFYAFKQGGLVFRVSETFWEVPKIRSFIEKFGCKVLVFLSEVSIQRVESIINKELSEDSRILVAGLNRSANATLFLFISNERANRYWSGIMTDLLWQDLRRGRLHGNPRVAFQEYSFPLREEAGVELGIEPEWLEFYLSMTYGGLGFGAFEIAKHEGHGVKIGRNDPCPCGSGKKYKKCCIGTG